MGLIRRSHVTTNIFSCIFGHQQTADIEVLNFCVKLNVKDIVYERQLKEKMVNTSGPNKVFDVATCKVIYIAMNNPCS